MPQDADNDASPVRVVVLGGGPAGAAAAYWLSAPEQKGRYQVTLYSQGWRLGGKCASGRNAAIANRIEEHGLHMLMGCYQNAFATLRACYLDWRQAKKDPKSPFQTWTDAFLPQRLVSMMALDGPGAPPSWSPWNFPFPPLPGEPGDGPLVRGSVQEPPLTGTEALLLRAADWLEQDTPANAPYRPALMAALAAVRAVFLTNVPTTTDAREALQRAADAIHRSLGPGAADESISQFLARLAILADIGVAAMLGFLRDIYDKGPGAWDALNTQDFRAWLGCCGASATSLASAPIAAFYDLTFAAVDGAAKGLGSGSLAAGVSLRAQMEIVLGYRNAPLFKMAAGMGDTVFTPFWDVLTARGVDIRLFSRVSEVMAGTSGEISEIDILTQAVTVGGAPYRPFTRVNELDCWPNQPDWSQLVDGAKLEADGVDFESSFCEVQVGPPTRLLAGQDFDIAILAMPPQALGPVAASLMAASPAWTAALDASASVATQSLQLWMAKSLEDLGWTYGPTVLTSFAEPYDSWGDMSQVLGRETWSGPTVPKSIGYFCGCLPPPIGAPISPPERLIAAVLAADAWMAADLTTLWPDVGSGPATAAFSRYDQANFDMSDTYVQTPAGGNVAARLNPGAPAGFSNLYVVGDWTLTRFSGRCLESAIESAMLASRAISGFPQAIKTD
jgi:uncharacterized protein with NAD-binding domain and iron-sulfur cluster